MSETLLGLGATTFVGTVAAAFKWGMNVSRRLTVLETVVPRIESKLDNMDEKLDTIVEHGRRR